MASIIFLWAAFLLHVPVNTLQSSSMSSIGISPSAPLMMNRECRKVIGPCILPYTLQYSLTCTKRCKQQGCEDGFCRINSNCKQTATYYLCDCFGCRSKKKNLLIFTETKKKP